MSSEAADELVQMARYGEEDELRAALEADSSTINHQNEWGQSALQCACANGHSSIVALLLSKGAQPNLENREGNTPLHWASLDGPARVREAAGGGEGRREPSKQGGKNSARRGVWKRTECGV